MRVGIDKLDSIYRASIRDEKNAMFDVDMMIYNQLLACGSGQCECLYPDGVLHNCVDKVPNEQRGVLLLTIKEIVTAVRRDHQPTIGFLATTVANAIKDIVSVSRMHRDIRHDVVRSIVIQAIYRHQRHVNLHNNNHAYH